MSQHVQITDLGEPGAHWRQKAQDRKESNTKPYRPTNQRLAGEHWDMFKASPRIALTVILSEAIGAKSPTDLRMV